MREGSAEAQLEYYLSLPAKRMASGVLFLDEQERILLVKPIYRPHWLLPGGVIEEHESPSEACVREVREELGLDCKVGPLLCVDYTRTIPGKSESVQFVFYGGALSGEDAVRFALQADELAEHGFFSLDAAVAIANPKLALRLPHCLQALREGKPIYLEDGKSHI